MVPIIETRRLCKEFPAGVWPLARLGRIGRSSERGGPRGPIRALRQVTLRLAEGEIYAILGPNGAGKTTLIKILSTLLRPSAGWARVAGYDVVREEARARESMGLVVGDERSFYWRLTGRQNLAFFGSLQGLGNGHLRARIDQLGDLLGLSDVLGRRFYTYSTGMRHRLALARGLLHEPRLLLLDEPTRSLDPAAAGAFHRLLRGLAEEQGKSILLITHQLAEARAVADRAALMVNGRLVLETSKPVELENYFALEFPEGQKSWRSTAMRPAARDSGTRHERELSRARGGSR